MAKKCVMCKKIIIVEGKKIKGTMLRVKEMNGEFGFIYVCPDCMKKDNWIEKAKIKGV